MQDGASGHETLIEEGTDYHRTVIETFIKGTSLAGRRAYVLARWGKERWDELVAGFPKDDRRILISILPVREYPLSLCARVDEEIARLAGAGERVRTFRDLGRASADANLGAVHASLVRGRTPHALLMSFPRVRSQYYSDGHATAVEVAPGNIQLEVIGAASVTEPDCESTAGYFERAIELVGAAGAQVEHVECRARGGRTCRFACTWRP